MQITSGVLAVPIKAVVYGPEGIGKSTFAAQAPEPLFIDTEGSTARMNVRRLPVPTLLSARLWCWIRQTGRNGCAGRACAPRTAKRGWKISAMARVTAMCSRISEEC